jgi:hypothetical protein
MDAIPRKYQRRRGGLDQGMISGSVIAVKFNDRINEGVLRQWYDHYRMASVAINPG